MENRIIDLFRKKKKNILSVFTTAGFPNLTDTVPVITQLAKEGIDMIEIGMPFSDPVADGDTIQASNKIALDNGMSLEVLFDQIKNIRVHVDIPLILMGYLNPVYQYGIEAFCKKASEIGIDGLILPDLPLDLYLEDYAEIFKKYHLSNILLITPQTSPTRIRQIDEASEGFIYMVSSNSITGKSSGISDQQKEYFQRIEAMNLKNPKIIGFGISDRATFSTACAHAEGAIIGSAFIRALTTDENLPNQIRAFAQSIKQELR